MHTLPHEFGQNLIKIKSLRRLVFSSGNGNFESNGDCLRCKRVPLTTYIHLFKVRRLLIKNVMGEIGVEFLDYTLDISRQFDQRTNPFMGLEQIEDSK